MVCSRAIYPGAVELTVIELHRRKSLLTFIKRKRSGFYEKIGYLLVIEIFID